MKKTVLKFTKTIKIRINVPSEQETLLRQMTEQYRQACNFISEYVFTHSFDLNFFSLNKVLYRNIRGKFRLKSQLAQSSIKTVIARYKTVKEQLLEHPYRYKRVSKIRFSLNFNKLYHIVL